MRTSIVVATYNGGQWLQEQLRSFETQTRLPDEVILSDDGSSDNTLDIAGEFARLAPFDVTVVRRNKPIGYSANFEYASHLASGDIVLFSDQDDVWFETKIETLLRAFESINASLITHDQVVVDENLAAQPESMLSRFALAHLDSSLYRKACATAIHRSLLQTCLPVPDGYAIDTWLHDVANAAGIRHIVRETLMAYRIHGANTSSFFLNRLAPPQQQATVASLLQKAHRRIATYLSPLDRIEGRALISENIADTAKNYLLSHQAQYGDAYLNRIDMLEAKARRLRRRARRRRRSMLWRLVYRWKH